MSFNALLTIIACLGDHFAVECIPNPIDNLATLGIHNVTPSVLPLCYPGVSPLHCLLVRISVALKVAPTTKRLKRIATENQIPFHD